VESPYPSSSSLSHEESLNNDTEVPAPIEDTSSTVAGNNSNIEVAGHVKDTNNPAAIFDDYWKSLVINSDLCFLWMFLYKIHKHVL